MQSGSGYLQSMSGWRKTGSPNCFCVYMEWMLVGTEMGVWHMSNHMTSECAFVHAQIKEGDKGGCREYR